MPALSHPEMSWTVAQASTGCVHARKPTIERESTRMISIESIQAAIFLLFIGVCFLAGTITVREHR